MRVYVIKLSFALFNDIIPQLQVVKTNWEDKREFSQIQKRKYVMDFQKQLLSGRDGKIWVYRQMEFIEQFICEILLKLDFLCVLLYHIKGYFNIQIRKVI